MNAVPPKRVVSLLTMVTWDEGWILQPRDSRLETYGDSNSQFQNWGDRRWASVKGLLFHVYSDWIFITGTEFDSQPWFLPLNIAIFGEASPHTNLSLNDFLTRKICSFPTGGQRCGVSLISELLSKAFLPKASSMTLSALINHYEYLLVSSRHWPWVIMSANH